MDPAEEIARLTRRLDRERRARLQAEAIAERGLRDLYENQQQLLLLEAIATAANESTSIRDVLQFALDQICQYAGWSLGHAYVVDDSCALPRLMSSRLWRGPGVSGAHEFILASEEMRFVSGEGLPGRVLSSRRPAWIMDVETDDNFPRLPQARAAKVRAAIAFPILVGDEVMGALEFFAENVQLPDAALLRLMAHIGTQLGRVIERKRAEDRLIHDASHDALTGLPNRLLFLDRLDRAVSRSRRHPELKFALLFIDLDRFKMVNDGLGHLAGDRLIVQVARRLQNSVRREDVVTRVDPDHPGVTEALARLGGDEFTLLVEDVQDYSDGVRVAERIHSALKSPFSIEGHDVHASASIGIVVSYGQYQSAGDMMRDADLAMYRAKSLGKARSEIFDHSMHANAVARLRLETDLRRAIQENEFVLHYQPIIALDDARIAGVEALVRWQRPGVGLVTPGEFIHVTEDTGLILPLGLWVLREACRKIQRWRQTCQGSHPLTISVNVSPRQFAQAELVDSIAAIFKETGVEPSQVRLEITEGVTMGEPDRAARVLTALRALGVKLSLDDFGTGYSSLSYLHRFPLDILKIDRSFVARIDRDGLQIVQAILSLARNLGMQVVAEGTETAAQVETLKNLGCHYAQGYYFSRPVDAAEMEKLLQRK